MKRRHEKYKVVPEWPAVSNFCPWTARKVSCAGAEADVERERTVLGHEPKPAKPNCSTRTQRSCWKEYNDRT